MSDKFIEFWKILYFAPIEMDLDLDFKILFHRKKLNIQEINDVP